MIQEQTAHARDSDQVTIVGLIVQITICNIPWAVFKGDARFACRRDPDCILTKTSICLVLNLVIASVSDTMHDVNSPVSASVFANLHDLKTR